MAKDYKRFRSDVKKDLRSEAPNWFYELSKKGYKLPRFYIKALIKYNR